MYPGYKRLGGAPFNFFFHIRQLTGSGTFISAVGNDEQGKDIIRFLSDHSFDSSFISVDTEHPTGEVKVTLDENKVPEFIIKENRAYDYITLTSSEKKRIVERNDLLYFGTLAQRNKVSRNTIQSLWNENITCFSDINLRQDYYSPDLLKDILLNSSVIKLNIDELQIIADTILHTSGDTESLGKQLIDEFAIELLSITMGSDGALLLNAKEKAYGKSTPEKVVDTVGAGDAFAAMLAVGFLSGWNISKTAKLAADFAADICSVSGAVPKDISFYHKYQGIINEQE